MMPITQLKVERLSLISEKPFESVLAAIKGGIGHPDMNRLWAEIWSAGSFQGVESLVTGRQGPHLHDRMASLLSVYNSPGATKIAEALDTKIETLMRSAL
jgi:hypothetical protein